MGPSNDHELGIARIVDRVSIEGRLHATLVPEVVTALVFPLSPADREFLARYIQWRMENPIAKSVAGP